MSHWPVCYESRLIGRCCMQMKLQSCCGAAMLPGSHAPVPNRVIVRDLQAPYPFLPSGCVLGAGCTGPSELWLTSDSPHPHVLPTRTDMLGTLIRTDPIPFPA